MYKNPDTLQKSRQFVLRFYIYKNPDTLRYAFFIEFLNFRIWRRGGGGGYMPKTMHFALHFYIQKTIHLALHFYIKKIDTLRYICICKKQCTLRYVFISKI